MRYLYVLLFAAAAAAQTEAPAPISADRPGFGLSTDVVPRGILQLESGLEFAVDREDGRGLHTWTHGITLARWGITRRFEFRLSSDGFSRREGASGWNDAAVGGKFRLLEETRYSPAVALVPTLSAPSGGSGFGSGSWDPWLAAAWSKSLYGWSLGGSYLAGPERAVSVSGGRGLDRLTTAFAEVWHTGGSWNAGAGVARAAGRSVQFDISAGRRMGPGAPSWFLAAGLVLRGPASFIGKTPARFRAAFR